MAVRVQITRAGDGLIVAGHPLAAGDVIVLDARTAARLVADGTAIYLSAQDPEAA